MAGLDQTDSHSTTVKAESSPSFFNEIYNKGVVATVEQRPLEAALVVGSVAALGAAAYLSHGTTAFKLLLNAKAAPEVESLLKPTIDLAKEGAMAEHGTAATGFKTATLSNLDESVSSLQAGPSSTSSPIFHLFVRPENMRATFSPSGASHAESAAEQFARGTEGGTIRAFESHGYRFLPARILAARIKNADGVTMRSVEGPSSIVFAENHSVQELQINEHATDLQRADSIMKAGYAGLIHEDKLAFDAASKMPIPKMGFTRSPIERLATVEELHANAVRGASAYVENRFAGASNQYAEYLSERFGPMTTDVREWGRHILSNTRAPESAWNSMMLPVEDTSLLSGSPINMIGRAASEFKAPTLEKAPWLRGAPIRGVSSFIRANA